MTHHTPSPKRLYRSETNRMIAGVAGGIAEYFDVDPVLVRLIFVLLLAAGGAGVFIYLVLWLIMPTASSVERSPSDDTVRANAEELRRAATNAGTRLESLVDFDRSRIWLGTILVLLGIILVTGNLVSGFFHLLVRLWPLLLVLVGIALLAERDRGDA